jgi:hypothetical protein
MVCILNGLIKNTLTITPFQKVKESMSIYVMVKPQIDYGVFLNNKKHS